MKIALIGTYPPPIGGTSVHMKRLYKYLFNNTEIKVTMYDTYASYSKKENLNDVKDINNAKKWLIKYLFLIKEDIIHLHGQDWKFRAALTFISKIRKKKIIITLHSFRDEMDKLSLLKKKAVEYTLKNVDLIIAVGENEKDKLIKWGCDENKIEVVSSFLLPINDSESELPDYIEKFINKHDIIVSANASNTNIYKGKDLYGIDMSIDLCSKLIKNYNLGFLFALTRITNENYYKKLKQRIIDLGLEDNFLFIHENMELIPILKKSDLFIRPTNTDSFGISVAEAIHCEIPSIASNVCKRPEGTILFNNRDFVDLYNKTNTVLKNYNLYKNKIKDINLKDNIDEILQIYKKVLKI